jgi:hypothetical protein
MWGINFLKLLAAIKIGSRTEGSQFFEAACSDKNGFSIF